MLKKTVTYQDWDGNTVTEDLYFNLTKSEIGFEEVGLVDQLELIQKTFQPPVRELKDSEKRLMLKLIKTLAEMSYGERIDARSFNKDGAWKRFIQTGAYDAFLWGLFDPNPQEAMNFMLEIMPAGAREQGLQELKEKRPDIYEQYVADEASVTHTVDQETGSVERQSSGVVPLSSTPTDDTPAWVRENRDPTTAEVRSMTTDQLQAEYLRKIGA